MSHESYESYTISPAELRRMETERRRREEEERRRQEELRRIAEEKRRQQEIAEAKQRIALMKELQKIGAGIQEKERQVYQETIEPVVLQRSETDNVIYFNSGAKSGASTRPGQNQLQDDIRVEMKQLVSIMKEKISQAPDEWRNAVGGELSGLYRAICEIEDSGYDTIHYESLMYHRKELFLAADRAEKIINQKAAEKERLYVEVNRLLIEARLIRERAVTAENTAQAVEIINRLETLYNESPGVITAQLPILGEELTLLREEHEELLAQADERKYVKGKIAEVLSRMGHTVLTDHVSPEVVSEATHDPLNTGTGNESTGDDGVDVLHIITDDRNVVRIRYSLDADVHMEFFETEQTMLQNGAIDYANQRWCHEWDNCRTALRDEGVYMSPMRVEPPLKNSSAEATAPNAYSKDPRKRKKTTLNYKARERRS